MSPSLLFVCPHVPDLYLSANPILIDHLPPRPMTMTKSMSE